MKFNPAHYLNDSEFIDYTAPKIAKLAQQLSTSDEISTVKNCFHFVRDEIYHSADYQLNPVTCSASQVLQHKTGYCYAKSHLLCALLRANHLPTGLCYQRLTIDDKAPPYCLHGLNSVYLQEFGWYRLDARGNRDDIDAQFSPPVEHLAFSTSLPGEQDFPDILVSPLPAVIHCLRTYHSWQQVAENLPDAQSI